MEIKMKNIIWFTIVSLFLSVYNVSAEELYYGLLHAHTSYSDGLGTPDEAFIRAKSKGISFFAVTPHNHSAAEDGAKERKDGVLIAKAHELYESDGLVDYADSSGKSYKNLSVLAAAKKDTTAKFLAIPGQEFSTISSGNHANVFFVNKVLEIKNGEYSALYKYLDELNDPSVFVQLNHPDVHSDLFYGGQNKGSLKNMNNDYGLDEYGGDFPKLVHAADRHVKLIEILSGPAMATKSNSVYVYKENHENDYFYYLTMGFHIAPSAGHDNHYRTWGDATDARMGVYADSLQKADFVKAIKKHKTFVTSDSTASISFSVNGNPMGSILSLPPGSDIEFTVEVTDKDEQVKDNLAIQIFSGQVSPQNSATYSQLNAKDFVLITEENEKIGQAFKYKDQSSGSAEFFYVKATEADGDTLWSAPIWINHPESDADNPVPVAPVNDDNDTYVWTSNNSKLYHHSWCNSVNRIKPENRITGTTPPENRKLHDCKGSDPENH